MNYTQMFGGDTFDVLDDGLMLRSAPDNLLEPGREITPVNPMDPALLGYPPTFPIEIAMRTSSVETICTDYGISSDEWEVIRNEEHFLADVKRALDMLKHEGMGFKLKARLQAEELLKTSWRTIHDQNTPPTVRAQLIQATVRWAGYDSPAQAGGSAAGSGFSININFSGEPRMRTING